jgi:YHS domain-containing protein
MGQKVGEKSPVATVRGRAYRICCPPCGQRMEKNPDKYLEPDGTPKNAKK